MTGDTATEEKNTKTAPPAMPQEAGEEVRPATTNIQQVQTPDSKTKSHLAVSAGGSSSSPGDAQRNVSENRGPFVRWLGWVVGDPRKSKKGQMPKTFGWSAIDHLAYRTLSFWSNLGISLCLALGFAQYGAHSREPDTFKAPPFKGFFKWCTGTIGNLTQKLEPGFSKALPANALRPFPSSSEAPILASMASKSIIGILLLSIGGTICFMMSYPLEKRKAALAPKLDAWWDKVRGHTPDEKELAEREKAYAYLNSNKSKEGFVKLLLARYLSVLWLIGSVIGLSVLDPTRGKRDRHGEITDITLKKTSDNMPTRMGLDWLGEGFKKSAELSSSGLMKLGLLKKMPDFLDKNTSQGRFVKGFLGIATLEVFGTSFTATSAWLKVKWREITGKVWQDEQDSALTSSPAVEDAKLSSSEKNASRSVNPATTESPTARDGGAARKPFAEKVTAEKAAERTTLAEPAMALA